MTAKVPEPSRDDWDVVDQASFDSFPASDPPGYYSSHASAAAVTVPRTEPEVAAAPDAADARDVVAPAGDRGESK